MSRPPKPPRLSKSPIGTFESRSTEAVDPGKTLGKEPDEQRCRQSDHIQVVALDGADESRAAPLDRVPARPSLPLAGRDIRAQLSRRQLAKRHPGRLVFDVFPARSG